MIRVFPRKTSWTPTDNLSFVGYPPLFRPPAQPVKISVVFSWDIPLALELKKAWSVYYSDVEIGGPAFNDPGKEFIPGRFIKDGVTFSSRGCVRRCPWCFVPKREGIIREIEIKPGHILQDNNILACSQEHIEKVFEMLRKQKKPINFRGGLDIRLLRPWHIDLFKTIKIDELWFAADSDAGLKSLMKAADLLSDFPPSKKRCYTMVGFEGELFYDAEARQEVVFELGFFPFCQLYQNEEKKIYPKEWRILSRNWSRPAIFNNKERRGNRDNESS